MNPNNIGGQLLETCKKLQLIMEKFTGWMLDIRGKHAESIRGLIRIIAALFIIPPAVLIFCAVLGLNNFAFYIALFACIISTGTVYQSSASCRRFNRQSKPMELTCCPLQKFISTSQTPPMYWQLSLTRPSDRFASC
jgi:hypothetical protein